MQNYRLLYEDGSRKDFQPHERSAARLVADFFQSDVIMQKKLITKNADLFIVKTTVRWEIKSPFGDGKRTIDNNLRAAAKQSKNIILDLRRCKMQENQALARIKNFLKREHHNIKRILLIQKNGKVIDISQ